MKIINDFVAAVKDALQKYFQFEGRATRPQYWYFFLFIMIAQIIAGIISPYLQSLVVIALFIPLLAVSIRRLHDIDKSGWYMLILLIPIVGFIFWVWFFSKAGTQGDNRFGSPVLAVAQPVQPAGNPTEKNDDNSVIR